MYLVNLTPYAASAAQREMGVIDVDKSVSHVIREKLSFSDCPDYALMQKRADEIAVIAETLCLKHKADGVLFYAKTFFVHPLVTALSIRGIKSYATYAPKTLISEGGELKSTYRHENIICCVN